MISLKKCLIAFIYVFMAIFLAISIFWSYQTSRVYYDRSVMYPALRANDTRLLIPFKIRPEEEEFKLGEVYIDKKGYIRQKKGEGQ